MQPNISDNSKVPGTISNSVSITPAPPLQQSHQNQLNELKVSVLRTYNPLQISLKLIFRLLFYRTIALRHVRMRRRRRSVRLLPRWHCASSSRRLCYR